MKRQFSVIPGRLLLNVKAPPSGGKELKKTYSSDKIRFLKTVYQMYRKGALREQENISVQWPFGDDVTGVSYKISQDEEENGLALSGLYIIV